MAPTPLTPHNPSLSLRHMSRVFRSWPTLLDDFVEFRCNVFVCVNRAHNLHDFPAVSLSRSRLCAEQRPFKRDEDGGFIVEGKECGGAAGGGGGGGLGGESDMDDGQRQQHASHNHEQNHDHRHHDHDQHHPHLHHHPPQDNMSVTGEERLVQSLGAVAINKRRKIDH